MLYWLWLSTFIQLQYELNDLSLLLDKYCNKFIQDLIFPISSIGIFYPLLSLTALPGLNRPLTVYINLDKSPYNSWFKGYCLSF